VAAQQHPTDRLLPWSATGAREVRLRDPGRARRAGGVKERACSVPGRSVRLGAGRSRPGRRSDDGQLILLRVQPRLERTAEQVCLDCQANSNPSPSPCCRRTSSLESNSASPAQPQIGTERDDDAARLCWRPKTNSTLRRSR
jgi:hypothetical protein